MAENRITGKVLWWNDAKGFGFLTPDSPPNAPQVFAHYSELAMVGFKTLSEGQTVSFSVVESHKGPVATDIIPSGAA